MTLTLRHGYYMTVRSLIALWRQPVWIGVTLVQPVIWLLLFGALFKRTVEIPGFEGGSYIQFLTPGVVVMTALFASGWNGMSTIEDLNRGVVDRLLVSPVARGAIIAGALGQAMLIIVIQSVIIIVLGLITGATFPGGAGGVLLLILVSALLGGAMGALSHGIALLTRKEETLIGAMNFFMLPLTFLSSAFMQRDLMPGWMQDVASVNPVEWAVEAGRNAVLEDLDWGLILSRVGLLALLVLLGGAFATRAFRSYQRSV